MSHDVRVWRERRAEPAPGDDLADAEYVFTRAELQVVASAILAALGDDAASLDTPFRLQEALATLIRGVGGRGDVVVRRSPAALLTPEYWQMALIQLDRAARDCLIEVLRASDR